MLFTLIKSNQQHKKERIEGQPEQALSLCLFVKLFLDKPETLPGCEKTRKGASFFINLLTRSCKGYSKISIE